MGVIRVLLAISVIIAHVAPIFGTNLVDPVVAVKAFYIISGFYMSLILNEKYIGTNNSYKLFISNRLLRLLPINWAVLVLTVAVGVGMGIKSHGAFWSPLQTWVDYYSRMGAGSIAYLIFTNIFLLGQDLVMFLGLNSHTGQLFFTTNFHQTSPHVYNFLLIPPAWTVGLEIMFYIIAPFIVRRKLAVVLVLILLSLSIRMILSRFGLTNDPWNYRFFPSELVFFLLGNLSYRLYKRIENIEMSKGLLAAVTGSVWLYSILYSPLEFPYKELVYYTVFFLAVPFIFKFSRRSRIDLAIGDLSYPMYLGHLFVALFIPWLGRPIALLGPATTIIILTTVLAIILNRFVTRPIERIRQARVHKLPRPVPATQ